MDFSLVIPMFNEEDLAESVIEQIKKVFDKETDLNYELILVNNGSIDHTGKILEKLSNENENIKVIHIKKNQGYGWGIINGLNNAKGKIIGYNDGDDQVPAEDILKVYNKLKEKNLIFCKAKRKRRKDGWKRISASFFYNNLFNLFFLTKLTDINAKPKLFTKEFYNSIELKSKDWFIDSELIINVLKVGYKPEETLVRFNARTAGKSNVSPIIIHEFLKNLIKYRINYPKN